MLYTLVRRAMIGITALVAIVVSFVFLRDLAIMTGWPPTIAYGLPACIDALAIMALLQYHHNGARAAAIVAAAAIGLSFAGNAVSHLMSTGHIAANWVAVSLVGGLPALSFGVVVHLAVSGRGKPSWDTGTAGRETGASSSASASGGPTGTVPSVPASSDAPAAASSESTKPGTARRRKAKVSSSKRGQTTPLGELSMHELRSSSLNVLVAKYGGSKSTWKDRKDSLANSEAQGASSPSSPDLALARSDP